MDLISYQQIRDFYNQHDQCWSDDLFSQMTTSFIDNYVNASLKHIKKNSVVLNAGSGGKTYNTNLLVYHLDIAENTLKKVDNAYVGNIIKMPFANNYFDCVICVGTVINYCEIEKAIQEIRRVSKDNSILILEYERSGSGLLPKKMRNQESIIFNHTYFGEKHQNMLYSDAYVKKVLKSNGYKVIKHRKFNTVIPFFEMFLSDETSHQLTFFEPIFRVLPIINSFSHNEIMICKKTEE